MLPPRHPQSLQPRSSHVPPRMDQQQQKNGLIDVLCQTIKNVVASASEAEMGGIYLGADTADQYA